MEKPFSVVHIGLGKCMSTSMQNYWRLSDNYEFLSATQIMNAAEKIIERHHPDREGVLNDYTKIVFDPPALPEGKIKVASEEGFSFSFLHSPELASYIPMKQEFLANLMAPHTDKVLLMVRNPIDWIMSAHSQQIKEGGHVSLSDYLQTHRDIILANLDLKALKGFWTKSGADLVTLPIELAKQDNELFWKAYETRLGFERPTQTEIELDVISQNKTLYKTMDVHRATNEILSKMEAIIQKEDFKDKDNALRALEYARRWGVRRALTFAGSEDLKQLEGIMGLDGVSANTGDIGLDQEFIDQIHENFISVLSEDADFVNYNCLEGYQEQLDSIQPAKAAA